MNDRIRPTVCKVFQNVHLFPQIYQKIRQNTNQAIQGDGRFHKKKSKPSKGMGISTKPCQFIKIQIKPSKGMGVSDAFPHTNQPIQMDGRFHKSKIKPSKGMGVSTKTKSSNIDFFTEADLKSEKFIISEIKERLIYTLLDSVWPRKCP